MQSMYFDHERRIVLLQRREIFDNFVLAIKYNLYLWRIHLALRNVLQVFSVKPIISERHVFQERHVFSRDQRCIPNILEILYDIPTEQWYEVQPQVIFEFLVKMRNHNFSQTTFFRVSQSKLTPEQSLGNFWVYIGKYQLLGSRSLNFSNIFYASSQNHLYFMVS